MKSLKKDQSGFITMIIVLLAILAVAVVFVYLRVSRVNS